MITVNIKQYIRDIPVIEQCIMCERVLVEVGTGGRNLFGQDCLPKYEREDGETILNPKYEWLDCGKLPAWAEGKVIHYLCSDCGNIKGGGKLAEK